jgi:formate dehydrogenase subunit gamma
MTANGHPPKPLDVEAVVAESVRRHVSQPGALLPIFHEIQDVLGFVPPESLARIAHALNLTRADVHGVLTFYHDFRTSPPGRHVVKLCRAEACQAMGCDSLIEETHRRFGAGLGETRADGAVTFAAVYCLGNCALGPAAMIDGRLHGRMSVPRLKALLPDVTVTA